jgi:hypothetical protein
LISRADGDQSLQHLPLVASAVATADQEAIPMIERPSFMPVEITLEKYRRWLDRKSVALVRRDTKRGNTQATRLAYREAIHCAVLKSGGRDAYAALLAYPPTAVIFGGCHVRFTMSSAGR